MTGSPLFAEDPDDTQVDAPSSGEPERRRSRPSDRPAQFAGGHSDGRGGTGGDGGGLADALVTGGTGVPRGTHGPAPTARAIALEDPPAPIQDPSARLRPGDAYRIRDGRYEPDTWWTKLRGQLAAWSKSNRERALDDADRQLKKLRTRGVRTGHLIAVGAAKGGTGKDTVAVTLGDVTASALRAPTLVLDADWDFGTLGERAPEEGRSSGTVLDVYARRNELVSPAQLGEYVTRMPSGCHLLSAPRDPDDMERLKVEHYAAVVAALRRFYSVIFVTMAPGVLAPICKWAFGAADQIVFVTDTRLVTADQTLRALPLLRKRHPQAPLSLVLNQVPTQPTPPQQHVIDAQLANGVSDRELLIPYDTRLDQQLDSGTLDLEDPDLPAAMKIALKQATLAVAERLG